MTSRPQSRQKTKNRACARTGLTADIHGFACIRQSIRAMDAVFVRRSALSFFAFALLLPLGGGAAEAAVTEGPRIAAHATAKAGDAGTMLARAKKAKRRPAGGGGAGKAKTADDEAADDAADEPSSTSTDKPAASGTAEDAPAANTEKVRKRPKMESESTADGDADAEATVSKKAATPSSEGEGEASETTGPAPTALELGFGAKALFRSLAWTADAKAAGLGPYTLTPGPQTGGWLEFYPAAFGSSGFAANVGLYGSFNYGFGVSTNTTLGTDIPTAFRDFMAGLKVRIPLGSVVPYVSVGYGQQAFQISAQGSSTDLPHLNYQFVRLGAGTRIHVTSSVSIDLGAAYLLVLDAGSGAGQIKSAAYFPSTRALGVDLGGSIAFRLTNMIGVRTGIDARLYSLAFNPQTDARPVSGAVDRYLVTYAGLEVILDGQGASHSSDDAEEAPKPAKRKKAPKSDDEEEAEEG